MIEFILASRGATILFSLSLRRTREFVGNARGTVTFRILINLRAEPEMKLLLGNNGEKTTGYWSKFR